jgi:diguanylate cyclase (GGDEF)-like protein
LKRVPGFGLVPTVALLAAGFIVALSFVVLHRLVTEDREGAIAEAAREARLVATEVLGPHLARPGGHVRMKAALDGYLADSPSHVDGLEILDPSGRVLYSHGRTPPGPRPGHLRAAVRGRTVHTVSAGPRGQTLHVLVPLDGNGRTTRLVRFVMAYDSVMSRSTTQATTLYLLLGDLVLVLGTVLALLLCFYRMAQTLREQSARNVHQALHDELTGLPNRALFRDRTEQAIARAHRDGRRAAVMIMDLDRFKEVNDTLGHHHGDLLLQEIGKRLRTLLREVDTIARFGGDEFAILLEDVDRVESALEVANKIRGAVGRSLVLGGFELSVDASIGIAFYPSHARDFNKLLQRADVAMYTAKARATGCEVYAEDRDHHSPDRLALAHSLKSAIESNELALHYQPKVDMQTGAADSVEALVRWQHPALGLVSPSEFITLAENAGLMGALTTWVLNAALRQLRAWSDQGLDTTVAVNISVRNLADEGLPEVISSLLQRYRVQASSLELEITESAVMADPARSIEILERLRALGCRITIDDFGTGHSSLAYLQRLPVTGLKIDRSFVANMLASTSDFMIVRSTIDLGRNLGLEVVAEGVEDAETWTALRELGCRYAQGYWSGRSTPPEQIPWLLNLVGTPALA